MPRDPHPSLIAPIKIRGRHFLLLGSDRARGGVVYYGGVSLKFEWLLFSAESVALSRPAEDRVQAASDMTEEPRYHGKRIAVVIPAYNEGLIIGSVILQAQQHVDRVIVVDDGSTDRTATIALLAGADIIRMPENGGKAKAMMAGFARARALGYRRPLLFFGIPVFLFTLLWLGAEIFAFSQYYHTAQFHYIIFTRGFVALILGLLLVTSGLILNSLMMIMKSSAATGRGSP